MVSMEIKDALALTASVCTALQFLAGVLVCRKYIQNGTTGSTSGLAFVICCASCVLWVRYGMLIGDKFIVYVNIFGMTLQAIYVSVFILYSVKKRTTIKQIVAALCALAYVYLYSFYENDKQVATYNVGLMSCVLTVIFFASPLSMLAHVIKVKNSESLPFPVIMASMIVSCQWFAYGCLLNDPFIQIPNFLGCVLSTFQLCVFLVYRNDQPDQELLV